MTESIADVSVVIPCYNNSDTVCRALGSVANQILPAAEVILVDDDSSDNTFAVLQQLKEQYRQGWVNVIRSTENMGPGGARNLGWRAARGRYIAFLDADDAWLPEKLASQYAWMQAHPDAVLTGHPCLIETTLSNNAVSSGSEPGAEQITPSRLLLSNYFNTPTVMVKRDINQRFLPGKRHSEDYLLWLQICCSGAPCYRLDTPLTVLHKPEFGASGLSANLVAMQRGEIDTLFRLYKENAIGTVAWLCFTLFSCLKFLRRLFIVSCRKLRST